MSYYSEPGIIINCSTPRTSNAAVGLIRISGFTDLVELSAFFSKDFGPMGPPDNGPIEPRKQYLTYLLDGNKKKIDEVLITYFKGPNSYTGENTLEITCHGNQLLIDQILNVFTSDGLCRLSKPGEFTQRALQNKKLTLSQVEGLDAFLNSTSPLVFNQSFKALKGELHSDYLDLREKFLKLKRAVELATDFSEDIGDERVNEELKSTRDEFSKLLNTLLKRVNFDKETFLSPNVVLVGPVNSGKSTLYNNLLGFDRSIVSDQQGTTRDFVSEPLSVGESTFRLVDTAGLRVTEDKVEVEGIKRSLDQLKNAFFKIFVINPGIELPEVYKNELKKIHFDLIVMTHAKDLTSVQLFNDYKANAFIVCDQMDLGQFYALDFGPIEPAQTGPIGPENIEGETGPIGPKNSENQVGPIEPDNFLLIGKDGPIEPKTGGPIGPDGQYINTIKVLIECKIKVLENIEPIIIQRHSSKISDLYNLFTEGFSEDVSSIDIGLMSNFCMEMAQILDELIGVVAPDDVLNDIFSNFCIGK
ncbi:MAG: tRNA modification GTPase [Bacteriovoracaceae bacterium]